MIDYEDTPDPWWVMPVVIGLIIGGLVGLGIYMSIEYVGTVGYEV